MQPSAPPSPQNTLQNRYRAAIIGTGRIAGTYDDEVQDRRDPTWYRGENRHVGIYTILPVNHAEAYQTTPGFELVAAANRTPEKLQAFGTRYSVAALYRDFRRLLAEEQPDVVSVCTQSPEKAEIVVAAAEAGVRAIVLEKAVATNMAEADAMIKACEANGALLVVNHPYRFSPMARAAKTAIQNGNIGPVSAITVHAAGGMLHTGTHALDLMRFLAGDVTSLDARIPDYRPGEDVAAKGTVEFAGGASGFFDFTHGDQQSMVVRGQAGYITLSTLLGDGLLYTIEPTQPPDAPRQYPARLRCRPLIDDDVERPHPISLTQRLLAELYASLTTGAPFISTGRDGAAALELGLACHAAHIAQAPVALPLADRSLRVHNR